MRRRRRSLIGVFYKHALLGSRATAKAREHKFTTGVKFCAQQTILSKKKGKKRRLCDMKTSTWTRGLVNSKISTKERRVEL
jgi:hypothetical protein